nr:MAG TPA: hypothetical protein [Caudoviricetes sp.]
MRNTSERGILQLQNKGGNQWIQLYRQSSVCTIRGYHKKT